MIDWQWKNFSQLTTDELYEILKVRQQVFAVEQNCVYQDVDGLDKMSWHLSGWENIGTAKKQLVAYCRIVFPKHKYTEPAIGRLLTTEEVRCSGLGKELLSHAITKTGLEYPGQSIRISAQLYLQKFYSQFGFKKVSESYLEDSIPHIEMLREGKSS